LPAATLFAHDFDVPRGRPKEIVLTHHRFVRLRRPHIGIGAPEAALVAVTMVWGSTFLVVQNALSVSGPFFFVGLRFALASLILSLFAGRSLLRITRGELKAGMAIGSAIALGYSLQTIGLTTILSSKSAFITALYVPFVPLIQWLVWRRAPDAAAWTGIAMAFAGLILLAGPDGASGSFGWGEMATVLCAAAFACEILLIGAFAGRVDIRRATAAQLGWASILAFAAMIPAGESIPPFSWLLVASAGGLALASAAVQVSMNWAQKTVPATRATIIYSGEPVWAGIFGRLAGEVLLPRAIAGAALIVAAIVVSRQRRPAIHEGAGADKNLIGPENS
jgi:drug/metabolite transporter (DMT)-like permease